MSNQSLRQTHWEQISQTTYDLIVVGGGITGAGIALDAASRGLLVLLLDKQDFAAGTSSRSTKLVHGGLRYLKQGEVKLVQEVGRERATVHRLAPHLVVPEKMLLPLIKGGNYGYWLTSLGLKVYDILAKVKGDDKRRMLGKTQALAHEPLLRSDILKGAGYYAEYRTDDARLTIEIIKTAQRFGALALNYAAVSELSYDEQGKINGVYIEDQLSPQKTKALGRYVVNATGPWVDELRQWDGSRHGKHLFLTKGVHLVVAHARFPIQQAVYFDAQDGRMVFAIPRGKVTYFGTTDTAYQGPLEEPEVTPEDVQYLLHAVRHVFPTVRLTNEDVISSWAGLRPLIYQMGKSPSELSRKDEIFWSDTGLISIAGGKLTGYRKMAQRVVDAVAQRLKTEAAMLIPPCHTDKIPLTPKPLADYYEVQQYITQQVGRLRNLQADLYYAPYLVHLYGTQTELIWEYFEEIYPAQTTDIDLAIILAELRFAIEHEMVQQPLDFLLRRTSRLYFDTDTLPRLLKPLLLTMHEAFGWDDDTLTKHHDELLQSLRTHALKYIKTLISS
ncbi:glycerol-3-phosphate dehydrogenase/oxidase [Eisenibacter elegans]|uniref:glycerol-3-phosphate dehydrogenase/oxidase n=1 Tax=Eisenibacter elegans TaxID=997 RepID=UPI0005504DF0|nr:glycerol-3-phosphate dehydrogenase/oxidase [Eisenibacter elegans]